MFTIDGVPMLFTGNEIADADEKHSMFGKTPMDWSQLDREPGRSRYALVKRLAEIRRRHSVFTDVNGEDGLTWLDVSAKKSATAFVRRNGREAVIVVQNWTGKPVECSVSFAVPKKKSGHFYIVADDTDFSVKGAVSPEAIYSRDAKFNGGLSFSLGPWGCWISKVVQTGK